MFELLYFVCLFLDVIQKTMVLFYRKNRNPSYRFVKIILQSDLKFVIFFLFIFLARSYLKCVILRWYRGTQNLWQLNQYSIVNFNLWTFRYVKLQSMALWGSNFLMIKLNFVVKSLLKESLQNLLFGLIDIPWFSINLHFLFHFMKFFRHIKRWILF